MRASKTKNRPWHPEPGEKFELATAGNASVKIYQRQRATITGEIRFIYEIADYTGGRRRMRGFGDLAKARKEADRVAGQLSSGNALAAGMRNADAASFGRAMELIRETGDPLELVASRYAEAVKILGSGARIVPAAQALASQSNIKQRTVAEVVTELLTEKDGKREQRTLDDLRNRLNAFAKDFAGPIATITKAEIQQWLDKLDGSERNRLNMRSKINTLF